MPERRRARPRRTGTLPGHRRLVIRGRLWQWRYGRDIRIVSPEGVSTRVPLTEFTGLTWEELERAEWKGYVTPVTPRKVSDHIARRILGYTDAVGFPKGSAEHGLAETPGDGWRAVAGPRGLWHWRADPCDVEIMSPEGVVVERRAYDVTGMGRERWFDLKMAEFNAAGLTLRDMGDIPDRMDNFMRRPIPGVAEPTEDDVRRAIRDIVQPIPA